MEELNANDRWLGTGKRFWEICDSKAGGNLAELMRMFAAGELDREEQDVVLRFHCSAAQVGVEVALVAQIRRLADLMENATSGGTELEEK